VTKTEIDFAKKLKKLFEDIGVKRTHYFCSYIVEKGDIMNLDGEFYIEFNDGTLIRIMDGEYGDLSCVEVMTKDEMERRKKECIEYSKKWGYKFKEVE